MHVAAPEPYKTKHKVRFVTATSLFDGHDASINVIRRLLQASGADVLVDVRGNRVRAKQVPLPFYKRAKK